MNPGVICVPVESLEVVAGYIKVDLIDQNMTQTIGINTYRTGSGSISLGVINFRSG